MDWKLLFDILKEYGLLGIILGILAFKSPAIIREVLYFIHVERESKRKHEY